MVTVGQNRLVAAILLVILSSSRAAVSVSFVESGPLSEGVIGRICLRAEGESDQEITVGVDTLNGSANAGEDFMLIDKHVVFGLFEGNQTRCVRAFIPSDGVYEGEENFTIIMTPPALVNTETQQMLVHINDSDIVTVGFRESSRSLEEGRSGEICFEAKGMSEREFGIRIQTQSGTASAVDYVPVDQEIVVGKFNGLSSHCIIVSTVEDNVLEKTESFFLTITTPSKNIKAESTELSVSILDDDVVSVGFEKPVFWNYEDDGEITVRVVMAGRSDTPITVLFTTYNVHALANEDYLPQEDVPVTFQPGEKVKEFGVTILNDSLAEGDEGFTATLTSQDKSVKIALSVAILGIWRSDGGTNY